LHGKKGGSASRRALFALIRERYSEGRRGARRLSDSSRNRTDTTASGMAFERPIKEIEAQLA